MAFRFRAEYMVVAAAATVDSVGHVVASPEFSMVFQRQMVRRPAELHALGGPAEGVVNLSTKTFTKLGGNRCKKSENCEHLWRGGRGGKNVFTRREEQRARRPAKQVPTAVDRRTVVAAGKPLCRTDSAAAVRLWRSCRGSWWGTATVTCGTTTLPPTPTRVLFSVLNRRHEHTAGFNPPKFSPVLYRIPVVNVFKKYLFINTMIEMFLLVYNWSWIKYAPPRKSTQTHILLCYCAGTMVHVYFNTFMCL